MNKGSRIVLFIVIILFLVLLIFFLTNYTNLNKVFIKERAEFITKNEDYEIKIFTEELIKDLPEPLKKHLRVSGYINTPIPVNADVYWTESWLKMAPDKDWQKLETTQFNSVKPIGRLAYMKFTEMPVAARDMYRNGYGEINGKLMNLVTVAFDNNPEVAQSALITVFCEFMFVPGYLLSDNIKWETIDDYSVRGTLEDNGIKVSGVFYFDKEGFFSHFETLDRYYTTGKNAYEKVKFSAVVDSYKTQGDFKICEKIKIIWHLPEGNYEYFKGIVDKIDFNVLH
ncbi:MAG: DUF6544 family protein [Candidatus Dojkabacteria bacterium]|jgi:hypothetical protein